MTNSILIKNATIVNEGQIFNADILIVNGIIDKIESVINEKADIEINAEGKYLLPGLIDDQVHFREPGLTHKATIYSESKAAVAGGITSFMEMPNTIPNTLTQSLLEDKYQIAAHHSLANFSFFMGTSNNNYDEVMKTDINNICGLKIFMGSSTGNMLVDDEKILNRIFENFPSLIAVHCEDELTIKNNLAKLQHTGTELNISHHPVIRDEEACYKSSSFAVGMAKKFNTRLHVLHISTAKELQLFSNKVPLYDKRITAEACIHHIWFNDKDYLSKGNFIKWNPSVKSENDQKEILNAINSNVIDIIATDHAPHTIEEKNQKYENAPSGGPLVQHALLALIDLYKSGKITLEKIVEKTAHHPAICFQIDRRGFIKEGYWADLVLIDLNGSENVNQSNILYKCGWSPFTNHTFKSKVTHTIVSGNLVYENGIFNETIKGKRLQFKR